VYVNLTSYKYCCDQLAGSDTNATAVTDHDRSSRHYTRCFLPQPATCNQQIFVVACNLRDGCRTKLSAKQQMKASKAQ